MRLHDVAALSLAALAALYAPALHGQDVGRIRGSIVDEETGEPVAARLYIQSAGGRRYLARSAAEAGDAAPYEKSRSETSTEVHTALSAHPFVAEVPAGEYTLTAERGKECLPATARLTVKADGETPVELRLKRWIDMPARGWFSGETHVHRDPGELPVAMLADDLNVALPLTWWVTQAGTPPTRGDKNLPAVEPEVIRVGPRHLIYPMNTEYEIFTVGEKRHALGAVFVLGHKTPLEHPAPPVAPIAEHARREGALLELDKHNWPWSMMLVPVMNVDLYELTNNHIWRTEFHFRQFYPEYVPRHLPIERDEQGMTERGWIDFTFGNYYLLLNCGFRLRPTAGTASGVHPVPLGFGRVYVHLDEELSFEGWMKGLDAGHSFVTTGPLLDVRLDGDLPGTTREETSPEHRHRLTGTAFGARPLSRIEVVSEGRVVATLAPANKRREAGGYESPLDIELAGDGSTWYALRCWEPAEDGRERFAHNAPWHIDVAGAPLRPRREEVDYLIGRIEDELQRHEGVLSEEALDEYRRALEVYRGLPSR